MSFFVNKFLKGKWIAKSASILSNKGKVLSILATLHSYMKNGGLLKVRKDLNLLSAYIGDIVHGHYHNYSKTSIITALAGIIYVISPLDIIPDFIFFGFADDIAIITWAIAKISKELSKYEEWRNSNVHRMTEEIEEVPYEEVF
jgi:uncharacterized membrane protein YkvA (DUF1232 family)